MLRRGRPFPGYEHWNPWMLQGLLAGGVGCSSCSVARVMLACFLLSPGLSIQCHFNLGLRTRRLASFTFPLATNL